jgi:hypothetical protein
MCIRTIPPRSIVLPPVLPLIRQSNLLKIIMAHQHRVPRATHLQVAGTMTIKVRVQPVVADKLHPRCRSLETLRIHSNLASTFTMARNTTLFLVHRHEYAGSVCPIMGQSQFPKESVVFLVLQGAARRNHPSRTGIRVPHHSTLTYLLVLHRPIPTADEPRARGRMTRRTMDNWCTEYLNSFRLMTISLSALRTFFFISGTISLCSYA